MVTQTILPWNRGLFKTFSINFSSNVLSIFPVVTVAALLTHLTSLPLCFFPRCRIMQTCSIIYWGLEQQTLSTNAGYVWLPTRVHMCTVNVMCKILRVIKESSRSYVGVIRVTRIRLWIVAAVWLLAFHFNAFKLQTLVVMISCFLCITLFYRLSLRICSLLAPLVVPSSSRTGHPCSACFTFGTMLDFFSVPHTLFVLHQSFCQTTGSFAPCPQVLSSAFWQTPGTL